LQTAGLCEAADRCARSVVIQSSPAGLRTSSIRASGPPFEIARVSGYLDRIHFTDGQLVKQGDLLFTIDKRPFQTTLDQARALAPDAARDETPAKRPKLSTSPPRAEPV